MLLTALALAAATRAPLALATYSYPKYDRAAALAPLAELLARHLERRVEVNLYASPEQLADAVAAGRVDVAMTNLAAYVRVSSLPRIKAIATLAVPDATLVQYRAVLLARRSAGVTSLSGATREARRLRYSEVLPGSASGGLVQAAQLRKVSGSSVSFASLRYAGTHEAALTDLLEGRADIAALAEQPWRELKMKQPALAATLVDVWRSAPLPPGPVICAETARLSCETVAKVLLHDGSGRTAASLAAGWSETAGAEAFVPVSLETYETFRAR